MWGILEACSCFVCMNDCLIGLDLAGVYGKRNFMDEPGWMNGGYFGVMAVDERDTPCALVCCLVLN